MILGRKSVSGRQCSDWSMSFERVTPQALEDVEGLHDFGAQDFTFATLARNETAIEALMDHFRAPHWDPLVRELDARDEPIAHLRKGPLGEEHLRLTESALGQARRG